MTVSRILVVAPDHGFRLSLEFALEAEGFAVDSHAALTAAMASPLAPTAVCAVVDEDAIVDRALGWEVLRHLPKPVVLLADRLRSVPDLPGTKVLAKPLLGNALIETVQLAIIGILAKAGSTASDAR